MTMHVARIVLAVAGFFAIGIFITNITNSQAPKPGDRFGNRCFTAQGYWIDCPTDQKAEKDELKALGQAKLLADIAYRDGTWARIDVIQTPAACIYIIVARGDSLSASAVARTDGKACQ